MHDKLYRSLILTAAVAALLAPGLARAQSDDAVDAAGDAVDAAGDAVDAAGDAVDAAGDAVDAAGDAVDAAGDAVDALDALGALNGLGKAVYGCSAHQKLTLDGKKLGKKKLGSPKTALFLSASGHCKVTIRNLRVEALHALSVSGHARVVIEDSAIVAGKVAIHVSGHGKVRAARSRVAGKLAVNAGGFGQAEFDAKTKVSGKLAGSKFTKIIHHKK